MKVEQIDIFGEASTIPRALIDPTNFPKAINDWAFCVQALLCYKKPVDYFTIVKEFGIIKFQTRIGELLSVYPDLVNVTDGISRKRLGRTVPVKKYFISDRQAATTLYFEVLNKKTLFSKYYKSKHGNEKKVVGAD